MTHLHLFRRGAVYYWRRRVPSEFVDLFGRTHFCRSLGTRDPAEGRVRARRASVVVDSLVQVLVEQVLTGKPPKQEDLDEVIRQLFDRIVESGEISRAMRSPNEELVLGIRPDPDAPLRRWMRDLQLNDHSIISWILRGALQERGLIMDAGSIEFRLLCRRVLRAGVQAMKINSERERGDYAEDETIRDALRDALHQAVAPNPVGVRSLPPDPASAATADVSVAPQPPLFSALIDEFIGDAIKTQGMTGQTEKQNRKTYSLWTEFHGDRPLGSYDRKEASEFRRALGLLPYTHGRAKEFSGPMRDVIESALREEAHRETAREDLPDGAVVPDHLVPIAFLESKTIKRHFSALSAYHKWLCENGHIPEETLNIWLGFRFPSTTPAKQQRKMWMPEQLQDLFTSPAWVGCQSADWRWEPGPIVIRDACFWAPLIGSHSGLRLEEICKLRVVDVCRDPATGIWYFDINEAVGRLKSPAAIRQVPIHDELIKIGFLDYVASIRHQMLFPELRPEGPSQKYSVSVSEWFTRYRRQRGIYERWRDFHSLRHTVETLLENTDAKTAWIDELLGHESDARAGEGKRRYLKAIFLQNLKATMDKLDLGLDLTHLYPAPKEP